MSKKASFPQWAKDAIREMEKLKIDDKITGLQFQDAMPYYVRGMVDGQLIIRHRPKGVRLWTYQCLSPAWWSVFSKSPNFKVQKKA